MSDRDHPDDQAAITATFELHAGPFLGRELTVRSFHGKEAVSKPYAFDVVFATTADPATIEPLLLGQPARLLVEVSGQGPRVVAGIVAWIQPETRAPAHGETAFELRIAPRLWLLHHRKQSRIYQNLTLVDIVDRLLAKASIPRSWDLARTPRARGYCVQYRESDYAFITRLLAEEGIFFYFREPFADDPYGVETLVLADDCNYPPLVGGSLGPILPFRDAHGMAPSAEAVSAFALRRSVRPNALVMRDFDFTRPMLNPTVSAAARRQVVDLAIRDKASAELAGAGVEAAHLELYEHHGEYEENDIDARRASTMLEQARRRALIAHGNGSSCRRLSPGHQFALEHHPVAELDGAYAVTRVIHEGRAVGHGVVGDDRQYENTFECVPADVAYRPKLPKRILKQVIETAIVVGPAGQEIYTDSYGRVKVQFHWDLDGQRNEQSSCWIRVAQAWSGAGHGHQFIPRIGAEVIVSFIGGDPDRPVIVASLPNASQVLPYTTPSRSGIRTSSTPGGEGRNELVFEDAAGSELLYLHAQRNLEEAAELDHVITTGGDERIAIAQNRAVDVGGSLRHGIARNEVVVVGGNRSVEVRANASEVIHGDRDSLVVGSRDQRVQGTDLLLIEGGALRTIMGGRLDEVGKSDTLHVSGDREVFVEGGASTAVGKGYAVAATGAVQISSPKSIRFTCGSSTIEVLPDEIVLSSKTITVAATTKVSVLAPKSSLALSDGSAVLAGGDTAVVASKQVTLKAKDAELDMKSGKARLIGKKVLAVSDGASLELDGSAALDGDQVKLNCKGGSDSAEDPDEPDDLATSWIELELLDQDKAPVAGARYVVEGGGGFTYSGALDASGVARVLVRPGSCKVSFPEFDGPSWDLG